MTSRVPISSKKASNATLRERFSLAAEEYQAVSAVIAGFDPATEQSSSAEPPVFGWN
ncbi:hypothetical protein SAMCCGM7_pC2040 (plasmid) [Sinorhizobium americanum CCGM7]|nr:hypothetical protein SAMCCGM7_pC2040 [Sinorhizobium americanum CCGM7]